ncbi:MAG TPA: TolC family protein [Armatimonadota bacterium]|jgi:outer membrane protein TolC
MRSRYLRSILPGLCLTLLAAFRAASAAADAPVPLSLADALRLAREHSPVIRAAGARLAGASARLKSAGLPANPSLSIAHGSGHDAAGLDEDVVLSQTLEAPGKTHPRVLSARSERLAAGAGQAVVGQDVTFNVQSAYYEALRADAERQLAGDALATATAFDAAAQTQFQAGDIPRSNVVRSGIERARARQALDAAEAERANRYAALRSLAGLPPGAPIALTSILTDQAASFSLAQLQGQALSRPDILAAQHLQKARSADVSEARAAWQPDILLEARRAALVPYADTPNGYSVRAGITLPLLDYGRNRSDLAAAQAALTEQQATLDETRRAAALEVETAYSAFVTAQKAVASFHSGRLDRAKELLDMAQTGYRNGASSYLELLDAQQVYRNEQVDYARALADENIALAGLQHAVGGTLP